MAEKATEIDQTQDELSPEERAAIRAQAIAELEALVKLPGSLKIITNIPDPAGADLPTEHPKHNVHHDVVEIAEWENHNGQYIARSAEYNAKDYGYDDRMTFDYITGQPDALLVRLREWRG